MWCVCDQSHSAAGELGESAGHVEAMIRRLARFFADRK
jgi:hypothetical protein